MPGYIIHLYEAKVILDYLEYNGLLQMDEHTRNQFLLGALLPDAVSKKEKEKSHFRNPNNRGEVVVSPDLNAYEAKYPISLKSNPILLGYYAHLHLDCVYFEEFFPKYVSFLDQAGKKTKHISNVTDVRLVNSDKKLDVRSFFSEEWLYGDYSKMNHWFIREKQIIVPRMDVAADGIIEEVSKSDLKSLLKQLEVFLSDDKSTSDLRVLSLDELDFFIILTAKTFVEKLLANMKLQNN